ncbi:hypothetical protein Pst134EA_015473 [Puccinia striiformis f. sp. tritici]|uniref:hypothetical protein n=1 Tax=Puccinia striiformis f. sp. tritici TaxID=168172 RepID=UPI002007551F|nr:hypothetical protein Pst134EA_015473 [Puccinia striiformis f. sp. tritici]KAH9463386.1 hypothetical protein Pst134EA_015473 [Puccinia striiformis f. sp. tritici]
MFEVSKRMISPTTVPGWHVRSRLADTITSTNTLRVHRVEEGRRSSEWPPHRKRWRFEGFDLDESPVDPVIRGLRDVEVIDRFMIDE